MLVLFIRAIIIYLLVFFVIRLTGKRQLSELQPFDLVITLLVADLASQPVSNTQVPLSYGVVPIIALFLLQKLLSFLSLKSDKVRSVMCGKPLIVIEKGQINEGFLREASYTINDLLEQLRKKDIFKLSDVEYAILETDGDLSVLLKGYAQQPTYLDMNLSAPYSEPSQVIIMDGKRIKDSLERAGLSEKWMQNQIKKAKCKCEKEVFFAMIDTDRKFHLQTKEKYGTRVYFFDMPEAKE
ncbi:MAG: DUF421 domain-containing protein [Clostridia bacterium]